MNISRDNSVSDVCHPSSPAQETTPPNSCIDLDPHPLTEFEKPGVIPNQQDTNLLRIDSDLVDASGPPHTILTDREIRFMTFMLSCIGICSSLSMPIFWVALTEIEKDFRITEEQTNMTVVAYLVMQALSPVFVSSAGDIFGRRPVVLVCLLGGVVVNIGLALCDTYWLMIFLRCLLATFVSPVISIMSSIVGDITTRKNRGGISGFVSGFTLIGQGLAPFLGSLVDTAWDWKAIFWFSALVDLVVLLFVFVCLPETKRTIVGNMSARPIRWEHMSGALLYFGKKRLCDTNRETLEPKVQTRYNPFITFAILVKPEVLFVLLPSSLIFSTWTISQTSLTTYLSKSYHYSTLMVGICFFAPGVATISGTVVSGKLMDYLYRRDKQRYDEKYSENSVRSKFAPPFNIIRARVGVYIIPSSIVMAFTLIFGWCLQNTENVSIILISAFFITFGAMYPLAVVATLMVDLYPERSGSAASLNNLGRCGLSAIFVACLSKMTSAMGLGGTYTLMFGLSLLGNVLIYYLTYRSEELILAKEERESEKRAQLGAIDDT